MQLITTTSEWWRIALLLVGGILLLDGIVLLLAHKFNLGTILPLLIGLVLLWHGVCWQQIANYLIQHPALQLAWKIGWLGFGLWLISFVFFIMLLKQSMSNIDTNGVSKKGDFSPKAIITLGSGFKDGKPTPTLASRLDKTAQLAKFYPQAYLVMSGGVGMNETLSEAEVMTNYLQAQHHLSSDKILLEDKSTSTQLNLQNIQPILQEKGIDMSEPIAIVTSDFHTLRASAIAKKQGYQNIQAFGSPTPLSIRYNAWLREYFAFVSGWVLQEY